MVRVRSDSNIQLFIERYGHIIISAIIFILTFMVNINVRLYGDDLHYIRFVSEDFGYFLRRHMEHYILANGRVIVHLLLTSFLGLDNLFWSLTNSLMLAGIIYFGSGISTVKSGISKNYNRFFSAIILGTAILFLDPAITRQSVYWLTGSFNYVYPVFMLVLYWFALSRGFYKNKIPWYVPVLAFLSAASVEQASLMAFGLTLLTLIEYRFFQGKKLSFRAYLTLTLAFAGMLSVIISPATFLRASVEEAPANTLVGLIKHNIYQIRDTFLLSNVMKPYHLAAMVSALGMIIKYGRNSSIKYRWIDNTILTIGGSACFAWLWQVTSGSGLMKGGRIVVLYQLFTLGGYLLMLLYAGLLFYLANPDGRPIIPLTAVILCFGSQLMMLISPVYGYRNLIFAIFMLALFASLLMPIFNIDGISVVYSCLVCFIFNNPWLIPIAFMTLLLILPGREGVKRSFAWLGIVTNYLLTAIIAMTVFIPTLMGYEKNAMVYDHNLLIAEHYRMNNQKGGLIQNKLPLELYGWAMPYHNPYYDGYYNLYIGVDIDTKIIWEE